MYLAALKSVPEQLYEAASVDGANFWQRTWYVTLPMMRNIIAITALFSLIVTFANFDIVRILTAGGRSIAPTCLPPGRSGRHPGQRYPAGRDRVAVHDPDPDDRRDLHPARHQPAGEPGMTAITTSPTRIATRPARRRRKRRSLSRDRRWALRWSYFFLTVFAIFFLLPPVYMLITSLKTSAEISAATNPWWVYNPTLGNYIELLSSSQYLTFFRNSAIVSLIVVAVTMLISVPAAFGCRGCGSGARPRSRPAFFSPTWSRRRCCSSRCSRCSPYSARRQG